MKGKGSSSRRFNKFRKSRYFITNTKEFQILRKLSEVYNFDLNSGSTSIDEKIEIDWDDMYLIFKGVTPYILEYAFRKPKEPKTQGGRKLIEIWNYIIRDKNYHYFGDDVIYIPITIFTYPLIVYQNWLPNAVKIKIIEKIREYYKEYVKSKLATHKSCEGDNIPSLPSGDKLYPFQCVGYKLIKQKLEKHGTVLLADEMGLGKTVQSLYWIYTSNNYPVLIVSPAILKANWKKEIESKLKIPSRQILVLNGTRPQLQFINPLEHIKKFKFAIINYDILAYWTDILKNAGFKTVIFDEAHYLKNRSSKRTKAAMEISQRIPYKILLTGTPIQNQPEELIPLLQIMNVFDKFASSITEYRKKFLIMTWIQRGRRGFWKILGTKNLDELNMKLRYYAMIRREKKDVLSQLPEKLIIENWISLNEKETQIYESAKNKMSNPTLILEELYRIRPSAQIPEYLKSDPDELMDYIYRRFPEIFLVLYNDLYRIVGELKIRSVIEWVKNYFDENPDKKLIIYAYHKSVQNRIYEKVIEEFGDKYPLKITGETKHGERARIVEKFQNDPKHKILVLSLKAAKEGLTLTASDTILFSELWWNPQDLTQAEDRIHRISQKSDNVEIHYMIAENTIDEKIWNILKNKKDIFERVVK